MGGFIMADMNSSGNIAFVECSDAMNSLERAIKRLIDVFVSFCGIVVLSPVFVLVGALISCKGGMAIYKQERIGYKGKPFMIYKFRTMYVDAEKNGVLRTKEERNSQMTSLGRFLSDYHLDELHQMFNVLIGDMSLVGPRPERQIFVDEILKVAPHYVNVYKMRPGLTSNATLCNGYTDTMEKMLIRLEMDLEYLSTRSLSGDFRLVCKTVCSIVSGKNF
jgi:lipopolysaccharide/colanic/teichoic acid biosynthesis glycosyltransferase